MDHYANEGLKRYIIEVNAIKSYLLSIGACLLSEKARLLEDVGKNGDIKYIKENHKSFMREYKGILGSISKNLIILKVIVILIALKKSKLIKKI